jgi:antitoxin component YwqK of YwqJK toxin-antitoxin module
MKYLKLNGIVFLLAMFFITGTLHAKCTINDDSWSSNSDHCVNGLMDGKTTAYHANGKLKYVGEFKKGDMTSGTIYFKNKPFYVGPIVDKEMHGNGVCFLKINRKVVSTIKVNV